MLEVIGSIAAPGRQRRMIRTTRASNKSVCNLLVLKKYVGKLVLSTLVMGVLRDGAVEEPCGTLFQDGSVSVNGGAEANELGPREKEVEVVVVGME